MNRSAIGIDARKIRDYGIGRYIEELLRALTDEPGTERYVLFAAEDPTRGIPPSLQAALPSERFSVTTIRAPLYSGREFLAFRGAAKRFHLDLLHFPHYVRAAWPGCPVAVTLHDAIHLSHPPSRAARVYARWMMSWSARSAACAFTVTEAARDELARHLHVPSTRFRVTPNGVGPRFSPPPPETVAEFRTRRRLEAPFVLCVASHRPHKNLRAAVDGFARAGLPGTKLVVPARDEEAAARLRPLVTAPGSRLLVGVPDEELPHLYAAARVVLCPSLAEGFGLPGLEAIACGGAVLATSIPAHREVLGDAVAYIDAPGRAEDIAGALAPLWTDGTTRANLGRRGPARAARFRWADTARLTLDGYRAAIEASRRRDL